MSAQQGSAAVAGGSPLLGAAVALRRTLAAMPKRLEARADAERDQLPLWLPVGFGIGIAAWFRLSDQPAWIAFLLVALAVAALALAFASASRSGRALAFFALAAARQDLDRAGRSGGARPWRRGGSGSRRISRRNWAAAGKGASPRRWRQATRAGSAKRMQRRCADRVSPTCCR